MRATKTFLKLFFTVFLLLFFAGCCFYTVSYAPTDVYKIDRSIEKARNNGDIGYILNALLKDADVKVRHDAALVLIDITPTTEPIISCLIKASKDREPKVRGRVGTSLKEIIEKCRGKVPLKSELMKALADAMYDEQNFHYFAPEVGKEGDFPMAHVMALALASFKGEALPYFSALLDGDSLTARKAALLGIKAIGPEAQGIIPKLLAMLNDANKEICAIVILDLASLGPPLPTVIPALTSVLCNQSEDFLVRGNAADTLAKIALNFDNKTDEALQPLLDELRKREKVFADIWVCQVILTNFRNVGLVSKRVVPALIDMLDDAREFTFTYKSKEKKTTLGFQSKSALEAITFQDFGYNQQQWRQWWHDENTRKKSAMDFANASDIYQLGREYHQSNPKRAILCYSKALELIPDLAKAYHMRGNLFLDKEWFYRALADYEKADKLNLKDTALFFEKGLAYEKIGRIKEAIQAYRMSIQYCTFSDLDKNIASAAEKKIMELSD